MHIADYQTPSRKCRVTEVSGAKGFGPDESRIHVEVRATAPKVEIFLGSAEAPSYVLQKINDSCQVCSLYVGEFRVKGDAVITEVIVHNG